MSIDMSAAAQNKWLVSLEDPGGFLSDGILLLAHLVCILIHLMLLSWCLTPHGAVFQVQNERHVTAIVLVGLVKEDQVPAETQVDKLGDRRGARTRTSTSRGLGLERTSTDSHKKSSSFIIKLLLNVDIFGPDVFVG